MKLLHLSDIHLGKSVNEFSLLEDQRFILQQVVDLIRKHKADALLIAGDVYDKSAPSAEAVSLLDWFLNEVAETGAPCFLTPGNHDSAERVAYAARLLETRNIYIAPVYDGTLRSVTLHDDFGPVTFWLMPFLKPSHVRAFFPDAEIGTDYTLACHAALSTCEINQTQRNVILSHQFVTAAGSDTERTESELSLGGMDNVDYHAYDAFDYVALGHVHGPQRVGRPEVRYSGSPLKYSFSEARGTKSIPLVTLEEKGTVHIELLPLTPLHDLREIRGPLEDLLAKEVVEPLSTQEREDYLHVILTNEHPVMDALAQVRSVYPNVMALEYDNTRSRAQSILQAEAPTSPQNIDPLELFQEFYAKANGAELTENQETVLRAALEETEENR